MPAEKLRALQGNPGSQRLGEGATAECWAVAVTAEQARALGRSSLPTHRRYVLKVLSGAGYESDDAAIDAAYAEVLYLQVVQAGGRGQEEDNQASLPCQQLLWLLCYCARTLAQHRLSENPPPHAGGHLLQAGHARVFPELVAWGVEGTRAERCPIAKRCCPPAVLPSWQQYGPQSSPQRLRRQAFFSRCRAPHCADPGGGVLRRDACQPSQGRARLVSCTVSGRGRGPEGLTESMPSLLERTARGPRRLLMRQVRQSPAGPVALELSSST